MDSWLFGSAADCDIVVSQRAVSGHHCRLRKEPDGFYLEDLGSTNGTFVGGQRITSPRRVTKGDSITLGTLIGLPWPVEASEDAAATAPDPTRGTVSEWPITKIFLSYRRGDSADVTGRIDDRLVDAFGRDNVFKDLDSIPLGVDFRVHLSEAVGACDVVLVVMGARWLEAKDESGNQRLADDADFVRIEVESALSRNIPVVPVLLGNAQMPKPDDLPPSMREICFRNATKVRPDPDFRPDMTRIIEGIKKANPVASAAASKQKAAPAKQSAGDHARKASTIAVKCYCGQTLRAPEKLAGKSAKCPACGSPVQIPAAGQTGATAASPSRAPTVAAPAPRPTAAAPAPASTSAAATQTTPRKRSLTTPLLIGCGSVVGAVVLFFAVIIAVGVFMEPDGAYDEYGYDEYGYDEPAYNETAYEAPEPPPEPPPGYPGEYSEPPAPVPDDLFGDAPAPPPPDAPLDDLFGDAPPEPGPAP